MKYLIIKEEDLLLLRNADFQTIKQVMSLSKSIDTDKFEEMADKKYNKKNMYAAIGYKEALNDIIK